MTTTQTRFVRTLTALSTLTLAASASAQTAWNREAEGIAILPNATGGWNIHAYASASSASTAPVDISTTALLALNGTTMDSWVLDITGGGSSGGCASACGSGQSCVCLEGVFCACGTIIFCIDGVGCVPAGASLQPEDEIMVLLRPAPGALPDEQTDDDLLIAHFDGGQRFWNRRVASAEAVEGAHSFFDINYVIEFEGNAADSSKLGTLVQLIDPSGAVLAEHTATGDPGQQAQGTFPHVPLPPEGGLTVVLRPAPGALPELPGFDEDDEQEVDRLCPEDVSGDGFIDVQDLLAVLAAWNTDDEDADINDDGIVDVQDLLAVLARWGVCEPV